jgi:cell division protein FtsI (penicillin-binding protein 3)
MVLVMDPRTGELLAVAIRPTFNPNVYQTATATEWRNRALTDPFEPGSTFKAILAAAALEEKVVRPDDRVYGEQGVITVANRTIHDWKKYGWLSFREVLKFSSNVGSIKVGLALGRERYYRYMTAFGFGAATGIDLPGESRGLLRPPSRWSGLSLATMSIGQEVSVTGIQMLTAFAAIANEGRLMQPHLVRALLDEGGHEVRRMESRAVRQVIAPETAATLTQILTAVVADGTGHKAQVPGYAVAGKTGTAQKRDPNTRAYSRKPGVLSFVGFVPAAAPRLAILALLDEPKTVVWGSEAAAPIFAAVASQALRHLDVAPSEDVPALQIVKASDPEAPPALVTAVGADAEEGVMPDLTGKSLRLALTLLAAHDLDIAVSGRGLVVRQTPSPGTPLAPGGFCRLELAPPAGLFRS